MRQEVSGMYKNVQDLIQSWYKVDIAGLGAFKYQDTSQVWTCLEISLH